MARKGALFTQTISNGPGTPQSFPSILTSAYSLMFGDYRLPLSRHRTTLAEVLKRHGYSTAAFHSNPYLSSYFNYNRGFDVFEDFLGQPKRIQERELAILKMKNRIKELLKIKEFNLRNFIRCIRKDVPYERADTLNNKAISWLNKNSNNFFLWMHYMDPHHPYMSPKRFCAKDISCLKIFKLNYKLKPHLISNEELRELIGLYDSEIKYVDHALGVFFNKLKEMGIWLDNTFIIITADHGEEFLEHGGMGHKPKLYEEYIHVPLIISGPGIEENVKVKGLVSLLDLAPTILNLLDVPSKPKSFLGRSLFPVKSAGSIGVISETPDEKNVYLSYRTDRWKYILKLKEMGMQHELYDIRRDPREIEDLSEEEHEKCVEYKSSLLKHLSMEAKTGTNFKRLIVYFEEEKIKERLKSLGYM